MKKNSTIFVQVVEKEARKLVLKRGVKAEDYFQYCNEVGCDVWGELLKIEDAIGEPMGMWLPDNMMKKDTSKYVQGVEVRNDFKGDIPQGYEIIELKPCKLMVFQGPKYEENDENMCEAINEVWDGINDFNPENYGFKWAEEAAPRFQFEPRGERGYIEGKPVVSID